MKAFQRFLALVAILFGAVTLFSGGRVLLGHDPGFLVYRPLLVFNVCMGLVYLAVGGLAWARLRVGMAGAALIFGLNLVVLVLVAWLYSADGGVAAQSVRAMSLRTGVWLLLFGGLALLVRRRRRLGDAAIA